MDNKNKQQKPRKKGSGLWVAVFFLVVWLINTVDFDDLAYRLSRLAGRRAGGRYAHAPCQGAREKAL